jgi:hypothetical protein
MQRARQQREAVEAIVTVGGKIWYDYQKYGDGGFWSRGDSTTPIWLRTLLGEDFFADVVVVYCELREFSDNDLKRLRGIPKLGFLYLEDAKITDAGLVHLAPLTKLELLQLDGTQITDTGLEHLEGLTNLAHLSLDGTRVSDRGVEKLRRAVPNCNIDR